MSSAPPPPATPAAPRASDDREIRIISHSTLFYWWPVWAIGFLLGLLSFFSGYRMVMVPAKSELYTNATATVTKAGNDQSTRSNLELIVVGDGGSLVKDHPEQLKDAEDGGKLLKLHVGPSKTFGVIFATVLLLVIIITNVPLRGMWSVVAIMTVIMLVIIFSLAGWWEHILGWVYLLHIHINAAGYIFISTVLLIAWLVTFYFFDQQVYMIFTPGQLKVRTEIGGGEVAYDTTGMTIQKQRSDLFRHWILGLGSGDLLVTTTGAAAHHFDLPNVLFIGKKVQLIEDMLREKAVVRGGR
jgi:hypothetical protein